MRIQMNTAGKPARTAPRPEQVLGKPVAPEAILDFLEQQPELSRNFKQLSPPLRQDFLDFCCGVSGLKVCYDPFFKYLFDVEIHPERLSQLLSSILGETVLVQRVLVNEGGRILSDSSLIVMDIVVELSDGTLANVEIQKIPYLFPGQRAACYSSDLLLRQYSMARNRSRGDFSYRKLRKVYTIILLEKSGPEFHRFSDQYVHRSCQTFDTGLELDLLQKYLYIPLDVFRKIYHNKGIETELEAWLAFLAFDDPEHIWQIQNRFPKFRELYADMVEFRKDVKEVLMMFSKALAIMDKNTVNYMIEEQQKELEQNKKTLAQDRKELAQNQKELAEKDDALARLSAELEALKAQMKADNPS